MLSYNCKKEIEETVEDIIEKYDLQHNNAEYYWTPDDLDLTIEAPNHWTLAISIDLEKFKSNDQLHNRRIILRKIRNIISDCDPEEEFTCIWSPEFGKHNNYSPFQFVEMLQEDYKFYQNVDTQILQELRGSNKLVCY